MKVQLTLNDENAKLLERIRKPFGYMTRAGFFLHLMHEEDKRQREESKRPRRGRPPANGGSPDDEGELPDENAPRTLKNPYPELVPFADRDKPINEYELIMLEEKHKMHEAQK